MRSLSFPGSLLYCPGGNYSSILLRGRRLPFIEARSLSSLFFLSLWCYDGRVSSVLFQDRCCLQERHTLQPEERVEQCEDHRYTREPGACHIPQFFVNIKTVKIFLNIFVSCCSVPKRTCIVQFKKIHLLPSLTFELSNFNGTIEK